MRLWVAAALIAAAGAAAAAEAPDVVLLHGHIHTQNAQRAVAQAMALRGNAIVAVGTDQSIAALGDGHTRIVELHGRVVLPGIIDAHVHPAESAQDLDKCSLHDRALGMAAIRARVRKCLRDNPGGPPQWFEV